jgi:hypothetical protein
MQLNWERLHALFGHLRSLKNPPTDGRLGPPHFIFIAESAFGLGLFYLALEDQDGVTCELDAVAIRILTCGFE